MKNFLMLWVMLIMSLTTFAQEGGVKGKVLSEGKPLEFINVFLAGTTYGSKTDTDGSYTIKSIPYGNYELRFSAIGYETVSKKIIVNSSEPIVLNVELKEAELSLEEVVVTGTMKEVSKLESPVPVEIYTPKFFQKNPTPNIFDALQNVNGVRPQLNCNVCNTGDIHINGLEGPYTMVLIDGMPIVSSLSTVYGLSGIPNSLVERIEIVKGPTSSLYGSEAVGGLINIITKKPANAPLFTADIFGTSWGEYSADLGYKFSAGKKADALIGLNYFNFLNTVDNNNDNFTDVTLQHRISVFNKWSFNRKENRTASIAARYFYEDRWGGEMQWIREFRGGDSIYGESIYTKRWEIIGNYQLPVQEKLNLWFSYNDHDQNSVYGNLPYMAQQRIAFGQLVWDKEISRHNVLTGLAMRYTYYDDNTPATAIADTLNPQNNPDNIYLPGIFVQDEISLNDKQKLLLGIRYDYNSAHGSIYTPRLAYKWSPNNKNVIRLNAGTGFRVVNLFTEEHAALTGARTVEVKEELKPEQTYNVNLNYVKKIYTKNDHFIGFDLTGWLTYFTNRIVPDYDTDPNKIIYDNLNGHAISKGVSLNVDVMLNNDLKIIAGGTLMDVSTVEENEMGEEVKEQQILTEKWMGTWAISYTIKPWGLGIDYTGNIYGPMRLPLLGDLDPRSPNSPVWSIQNIQLTKNFKKGLEIYGGLKNILNWTPNKGNPFIIARANDPFDKNVQFDANGQVMATVDNPYALTFDPAYVYGPNQGIRGFLGIRWTIQ